MEKIKNTTEQAKTRPHESGVQEESCTWCIASKIKLAMYSGQRGYRISWIVREWGRNCCLTANEQCSTISWSEQVTFDQMMSMSTLY